MKKFVWSHERFDIENNVVWFVPYYSSVLCGFDLVKKEISTVKTLDGEGNKIDGYINLLRIRDYIVLIPSYGSKIILYNMVDGSEYTYRLEECSLAKYFPGIYDGTKILLFPFAAKKIIEIELQSDNSPMFREIDTEVNGFVSVTLHNQKIYGVKNDDSLYEYVSDGIFIKNKTVSDRAFVDVISSDRGLFVLDADGMIYIYKEAENSFSEWVNMNYLCHSIEVFDNRVFVFSEKNELIFESINIDTRGRKEHKLNITGPTSQWKGNVFSKSICRQGKIYVMNLKVQALIEMDPVTDEVSLYYMELPELGFEEKLKMLKEDLQNGCALENKHVDMGLEFYIMALPYI